ncbi:hypothetical protein [Burkholderia guangdongensis]|nr:hypothetical protein [Burkholderia guangdongensis]
MYHHQSHEGFSEYPRHLDGGARQTVRAANGKPLKVYGQVVVR